jgi:hypothetical protein
MAHTSGRDAAADVLSDGDAVPDGDAVVADGLGVPLEAPA